jgi:CheY-like chemotaxis protein
MAEETFVLLDDNEDDRALMQAAFKRILPNGHFFGLSSPDEVRAYLCGKQQYGDRSKYPFPSVLMIDRKLAAADDGPKVIKWIRSHPNCNRLILVMISGNLSQAAIDSAYDAGANSFLQKPVGLKELVSLMECVRKYWLECSHLPSSPGPCISAD